MESIVFLDEIKQNIPDHFFISMIPTWWCPVPYHGGQVPVPVLLMAIVAELWPPVYTVEAAGSATRLLIIMFLNLTSLQLKAILVVVDHSMARANHS